MNRRACAAMAAAVVVGLGVVVPVGAGAADRPTIHVDQNSCSSAADGSAAYPFCSIQAAADVVEPGQTVVVAGGIYRESVTLRRSGTPERPIVFVGGARD
ncbi:hypothetical protein AB0I39_30335 [Kitasatospora purpeofusca]|uniref:hypothetical protein n=1 Tax=Kitasatospora purpeofusca TaxID=67352 RepID=UPI0033DD1B4B